jgi:hypothetical protein
MPNTLDATDRAKRTLPSLTEGNGARKRSIRNGRGQTAANPFRRRFDRVSIGFFLGGIGLAAVGAGIAASFPYKYPAALVVSILWWGIYCGCLGASLGALAGLLTQPAPATPSPGSVGDGHLPTGADMDFPVCPAGPTGRPGGAVFSRTGGTRGYLPSGLEFPEKISGQQRCRISKLIVLPVRRCAGA